MPLDSSLFRNETSDLLSKHVHSGFWLSWTKKRSTGEINDSQVIPRTLALLSTTAVSSSRLLILHASVLIECWKLRLNRFQDLQVF